jgi:hypothetical protein
LLSKLATLKESIIKDIDMDDMEKSEFLKKFQDLETNFVLKHGIVPIDLYEFCTEIPVILKKGKNVMNVEHKNLQYESDKASLQQKNS